MVSEVILQTAMFVDGPLDKRVAKIAFPKSIHVGMRYSISGCIYVVQDGSIARCVIKSGLEFIGGAIVLKWEKSPVADEVLENEILGKAPSEAVIDDPNKVEEAPPEPKATRMNYGQIAKLMNWIATRPEASFASLLDAEKAAEEAVGFRVTGYSIQKAWDESGRTGSLLAVAPLDNAELARRLSILEGAVARLELLVKPI